MYFSDKFICATQEYSSYDKFVPSPYFRKEFELCAGINALDITICGLGFYRLWINGKEITKGIIAPYVSNPDDIKYYDRYDILNCVNEGKNVIGIQLGNGMLNNPGGEIWDFEKASFRRSPCVAFSVEGETVDGERIFFEADEEDYLLFENEIVRDIFIRVYSLADENGQLHSHVEDGLYMWEELVHDEMMLYINLAVEEYDKETVGKRDISTANLGRTIGGTLLIHHFDRYVYHSIRLMIPSFIASVFFQIRPIYLLCHFITLLIYLFAISGIIWLRKNGGNRKLIDYMAGIVVTLILMVIIVNLVFTGLQRYVVYGMGIFWCGMYLQLKEVWILLRQKDAIKMPIFKGRI